MNILKFIISVILTLFLATSQNAYADISDAECVEQWMQEPMPGLALSTALQNCHINARVSCVESEMSSYSLPDAIDICVCLEALKVDTSIGPELALTKCRDLVVTSDTIDSAPRLPSPPAPRPTTPDQEEESPREPSQEEETSTVPLPETDTGISTSLTIEEQKALDSGLDPYATGITDASFLKGLLESAGYFGYSPPYIDCRNKTDLGCLTHLLFNPAFFSYFYPSVLYDRVEIFMFDGRIYGDYCQYNPIPLEVSDPLFELKTDIITDAAQYHCDDPDPDCLSHLADSMKAFTFTNLKDSASIILPLPFSLDISTFAAYAIAVRKDDVAESKRFDILVKIDRRQQDPETPLVPLSQCDLNPIEPSFSMSINNTTECDYFVPGSKAETHVDPGNVFHGTLLHKGISYFYDECHNLTHVFHRPSPDLEVKDFYFTYNETSVDPGTETCLVRVFSACGDEHFKVTYTFGCEYKIDVKGSVVRQSVITRFTQ